MFRSVLGLVIGSLAGVFIGVFLLILFLGPSDYHNAKGEASDMAMALTYAFGLYGAIGGGFLGLMVGMFSAVGARRVRPWGWVEDAPSDDVAEQPDPDTERQSSHHLPAKHNNAMPPDRE